MKRARWRLRAATGLASLEEELGALPAGAGRFPGRAIG
jgi:hypothetical protein